MPEWRQRSVTASEPSTVCSTACANQHRKKDIKAPHYEPFVRGIHRWWMDSPHGCTYMRKMKQSWVPGRTVYPKKYAQGFVVLCFVVVMQSSIMNSHEVFIHIHQGCFAGTGPIVRLPKCQWSKPDGYGKISQCITTTKHSKAKTVCIFLGIYCMCRFQIGYHWLPVEQPWHTLVNDSHESNKWYLHKVSPFCLSFWTITNDHCKNNYWHCVSYCVLHLQELCQFGRFRQLTNKIKELLTADRCVLGGIFCIYICYWYIWIVSSSVLVPDTKGLIFFRRHFKSIFGNEKYDFL